MHCMSLGALLHKIPQCAHENVSCEEGRGGGGDTCGRLGSLGPRDGDKKCTEDGDMVHEVCDVIEGYIQVMQVSNCKAQFQV